MEHTIKIQDIGFIRHNVLRIKTDRPANYSFTPGQATEMAINQPRMEKREKTFYVYKFTERWVFGVYH
ncbi:hypothetical protein [Maribacter litopenaei]|uniref:hypothetical protein n=1 Tax=Maribacter litopenaei TaxID=2976127 RepID=UPI0030841960